MTLPEEFARRIKALMGIKYPAFARAMTETAAVRALRVNTVKISESRFQELCTLSLSGSGVQGCYIFNEDKIGADPLHFAGAYYVQDPSAAAAVAAAAEYIRPDMLALDMCASPGGKSTQLAAYLENGALVSNEIVPQRCRILRGNIERLGIKNAAVTCLEPSQLAVLCPGLFDFVLCDAPCSGEGMFRKYEEALLNWTPANVEMCAARQADILDSAAATVAPGGYLLYSTCTFSVEENEMNVDSFLRRHPDFYLARPAESIVSITADGIDFPGCRNDMSFCRRFYPHLSPGEGQFIAIMRRNSDIAVTSAKSRRSVGTNTSKQADRNRLSVLKGAEARACAEFLESIIEKSERSTAVRRLRNDIMLLPEPMTRLPDGLPAVLWGICAGTVTPSGRVEPHHHLFSASGSHMTNRLSLSLDDPRLRAYLRGETVECDCNMRSWCAILAEEVALGGGKAVCGTMKNHYPKGLRLRDA